MLLTPLETISTTPPPSGYSWHHPLRKLGVRLGKGASIRNATSKSPHTTMTHPKPHREKHHRRRAKPNVTNCRLDKKTGP